MYAHAHTHAHAYTLSLRCLARFYITITAVTIITLAVASMANSSSVVANASRRATTTTTTAPPGIASWCARVIGAARRGDAACVNALVGHAERWRMCDVVARMTSHQRATLAVATLSATLDAVDDARRAAMTGAVRRLAVCLRGTALYGAATPTTTMTTNATAESTATTTPPTTHARRASATRIARRRRRITTSRWWAEAPATRQDESIVAVAAAASSSSSYRSRPMTTAMIVSWDALNDASHGDVVRAVRTAAAIDAYGDSLGMRLDAVALAIVDAVTDADGCVVPIAANNAAERARVAAVVTSIVAVAVGGDTTRSAGGHDDAAMDVARVSRAAPSTTLQTDDVTRACACCSSKATIARHVLPMMTFTDAMCIA